MSILQELCHDVEHWSRDNLKNSSEWTFKDQPHSPPEARRHLRNFLKIHCVGSRSTCLNGWKTLLNGCEYHRDAFCCENAVYKHDFASKNPSETVKFPDLSRFWLVMLGFSTGDWKDPRQQSTKVQKWKVEGVSFKKHPTFLKSVQ